MNYRFTFERTLFRDGGGYESDPVTIIVVANTETAARSKAGRLSGEPLQGHLWGLGLVSIEELA